MNLLTLYKRAIGLLAAEKWLAIALAEASVAIGLVQLAEPILFGRVVDSLSRGPDPTTPTLRYHRCTPPLAGIYSKKSLPMGQATTV